MVRPCRRSLRSCSMLSCLFCLALAFMNPAVAQQPATRLNLGTPVFTFTPDMELPVPVTINAQGEGVVHVAMEVGYPGKLLKFVGIKSGSSVEKANGRAHAEEKAARAAGADEQVLTIEIESPEPIAIGTLAMLTFRPVGEAKGGMEISLRVISRAANPAGGKEMETQGADGKITLTAVVPSCFFYMH